MKQSIQKEVKKKKDISNPKKGFWTKKKVIITICTIIFIVATASGFLWYLSVEKQNKKLIKNIASQNTKAWTNYKENIEYGTEIKYEDLLAKLVYSKKIYENTKLEMTVDGKKEAVYSFIKVGTVEVVVTFKNNKKTIVKKKKLTIEDTQKPSLQGIENKIITVGDAIDVKAGITAEDPVDGPLEVTLDGSVDTNVAGEYRITVKATDKNGNEVTGEFIVTVQEKVISTPTSGSSGKPSPGGTSKPAGGSTASSAKAQRAAEASAEARRVVGQITSAGMSNEQKARAIVTYITNSVAVQTNQSTEAYKTNYGNEAYSALIMKISACSGRSKAVLLMCSAAGLQCQHINAGAWGHQWNTVLLDGNWIIMDAQIGWFGGTVHPTQW